MKLKALLALSIILVGILASCKSDENESNSTMSDVSRQESSLGEISWDEVSKDYSAEKQIGESGIFIAVKKLSSSQKVYALEKDGKLITDFEFDTVSVIGSQYIVLAKNDNIAEIRDFSGNKICNTAYRIAAHEEKGGACVISRYVGEYSEKRKEFAVAKGGTRIQGDASGDILLDGETVTDFEFDSYEISDDCEYIAMKKSGRITALFRCDGTKADGTLYTVAKATDGGAYAVVKTDGGKRTYAVVRGGTLIGDTLLGGELLTGFDFDSCRLDASGCLVLENGGNIAEVRKADGTKLEGTFYSIAGEVKGSSIYVVRKRDGQKPAYAVVKGGTKADGGLLEGGEMLTGFDFDSYNILTTGYIVLKKDGEIAEVRDADGDVYTQSAYEKISGFSVGDIYAVRTGSGKDTRYALARGGYDFGGVVREPTLLTDFEYTTVKGLNYSNSDSDNRPTRFALLEKADGSREIRNSDGRVALSGQFSEVIPFYGMLVVKAEKGYDLYNGDGTKTGVTGFRNIFSKQIEEYRIIKTTADSGEVRYSVMNAIDGSRLILENYDENAVCDRYYDAILATVTELVRAVKNDDFAALRKVAADEELVRKYEALLGRYNAGDRAGLTDDPSFGLLNLRLNYYDFNGTVTASERVAFVDAQSGRAEALFTVPIYDETHPMGYSETVSLVSDGKGNFRISAVGYHLFDYPDMLYYNGQEDTN